MATEKVRNAIAATVSSLAPDLPVALDLPDRTSCTLYLVAAESLSPERKDDIYRIFNTNMYDLSQSSSMKYNERSKREELFDPLTRYLLLLRPSPHVEDTDLPMPGALPRRTSSKGKQRASDTAEPQGDLLGYCSFRFDTEETLGTRDAEVIYCYELQLTAEVKGKGLGKILMDRLEGIGSDRRMEKAMLTCLKGNTSALSFYKRQGYRPDEIDPTRLDEEEGEDEWEDVGSDGEQDRTTVDYAILSKSFKDR